MDRPIDPGMRSGHRGWRAVRRLIEALLVFVVVGAGAVGADERSVTCLGRLEPGDGVLQMASPSGGGVIDSLEVAEGDRVEAGQIIATLVTRPLRLAQVARLQAELEQAQHDEARLSKLSRGNAASAAKSDTAEIAVRVARANLNAALAELALSEVRSPIAGEVLEVHARAGELIGPEGVIELGETDRMYAIAEVYETDIGLVQLGQKATLSSSALAQSLTGTVDRIGMKIGRMDVIGTDPIAKTDARVVEVRIALDDSAKARALTHLQVEVEIEP